MVSNIPFSGSYDYKFMYNRHDLRAPIALPPKSKYPSNVMEFLDSNDDLKNFAYMVRLGNLESTFADPQLKATIFVPSDFFLKKSGIETDTFINMDVGTARDVVRTSMLPDLFPEDLLKQQPYSYFFTQNAGNKILISTLRGETEINGCAKVVKFDIKLSNGIIHIVDGLVKPINQEVVGNSIW